MHNSTISTTAIYHSSLDKATLEIKHRGRETRATLRRKQFHVDEASLNGEPDEGILSTPSNRRHSANRNLQKYLRSLNATLHFFIIKMMNETSYEILAHEIIVKRI